MVGLYTEDFNFLEIRWKDWISNELYHYIINYNHDNYLKIKPSERESNIWIIVTIHDTMIITLLNSFCIYCIRNYMNTEENCLTLITTPKEMFYIIKYVKTKSYPIIDILTVIMNTFIRNFIVDLVLKNNIQIVQVLNIFININTRRLKERRMIGALCLNRIPGFDQNINTHIIQFLR